jgi:hypothetical protein
MVSFRLMAVLAATIMHRKLTFFSSKCRSLDGNGHGSAVPYPDEVAAVFRVLLQHSAVSAGKRYLAGGHRLN